MEKFGGRGGRRRWWLLRRRTFSSSCGYLLLLLLTNSQSVRPMATSAARRNSRAASLRCAEKCSFPDQQLTVFPSYTPFPSLVHSFTSSTHRFDRFCLPPNRSHADPFLRLYVWPPCRHPWLKATEDVTCERHCFWPFQN